LCIHAADPDRDDSAKSAPQRRCAAVVIAPFILAGNAL
jgi:hypothetical protein